MGSARAAWWGWVALPLLLGACATSPSARPQASLQVQSADEWEPYPAPRGVPAALEPGFTASAGERVAAHAARLVGLGSLRSVSRSLPDDCTGFVRYAYAKEGVELMRPSGSGSNGVTFIFRAMRACGALHAQTPQPGDLVFFRETYDRDRDGARDDGLTHVAIVEAVASDGTVTFMHRAGKGIARAHMNLAAGDRRTDEHGRAINDYLRAARKGSPAALAAQLFVGYASAARILADCYGPALSAR